MQHGKLAELLSAAMEHALRDSDDALIEQALAESTSDAVWRALAAALDRALQAPGEAAALHLRLFAIPILHRHGRAGSLVVPGLVPDIRELTAVFEANGALGPMKNFGLSTALVSAQGLARLKPSAGLSPAARNRSG